MTIAEMLQAAQKLAPCYFTCPNDGAYYKCPDCNRLYLGDKMLKTFTPDGISHYAVCVDCLDSDWLENAKDISDIWRWEA